MKTAFAALRAPLIPCFSCKSIPGQGSAIIPVGAINGHKRLAIMSGIPNSASKRR